MLYTQRREYKLLGNKNTDNMLAKLTKVQQETK
jgi:hypothetical protein